jgi:hypothetical protein
MQAQSVVSNLNTDTGRGALQPSGKSSESGVPMNYSVRIPYLRCCGGGKEVRHAGLPTVCFALSVLGWARSTELLSGYLSVRIRTCSGHTQAGNAQAINRADLDFVTSIDRRGSEAAEAALELSGESKRSVGQSRQTGRGRTHFKVQRSPYLISCSKISHVWKPLPRPVTITARLPLLL